MSWSDELTELKNVLADLYPEKERSFTVVDEAQIPRDNIRFSDIAIDNWHGILLEAERRGQVKSLTDVALRAYPENEALARAASAYLSRPPGPLEPVRNQLTRRPAALIAGALLVIAIAAAIIWMRGQEPAVLWRTDFSDTSRWFFTSLPGKQVVQPVAEGADNPENPCHENCLLRFYPPGGDDVAEARRQPMDDVPLSDACTVQFRVRPNLRDGAKLGAEKSDGSFFVTQGNERLAVAIAPEIGDQSLNAWQPITLELHNLRGLRTNAPYERDVPVGNIGFQFRLDENGSSIDVDDLAFVACA